MYWNHGNRSMSPSQCLLFIMNRIFFRKLVFVFNPLVYLQQIKKKAEAESKKCHAKTMLSLEKPIKLI